MKYTAFHEQQFHQSVNTAMETVRRILDVERNPLLAGHEDAPAHTYGEKFVLTEFLTNTAVAAILNALTNAGGLQPDVQKTVQSWTSAAVDPDEPSESTSGTDAKKPKASSKSTSKSKSPRSITLRFLAEDTCSFLNEADVEVVTGETHEVTATTKSNTNNTTTSVSGFFGSGKEKEETVSVKVTTRVKEFHWRVGIRYQLLLFYGTRVDQAVVLQQRQTESFIVTQLGSAARGTKIKAPLPEHTLHPAVDTDVTWIFSMIDAADDQACRFAIDRDHVDCRTPRRNPDVDTAVDCMKHLHDWARIVQGYFVQRLEKEIMGKDNPVHPRSTATTTATTNAPSNAQPPQQQRPMMDPVTGILEPGAIGTMQGLAKEPTFNGQQIRIVEYNAEQQRYKAEPVNVNAGLPATLSIKPGNIRPYFAAMTDATTRPLSSVVTTAGPPLHTITQNGLFCPIVPLLENGSVLSLTDVGDFLQEQARSLDDALDVLSRAYPPRNLVKLVSVTEATMVLLCQHLEQLTVQYHDSVDYVEDMLKQQLTTAIGKEVTRQDFEQFMRFYHPKFFGPAYAPQPFAQAIRRPGHYPDGIVTIEAVATSSSPGLFGFGKTPKDSSEPITTWVRRVPGTTGGSSSGDTGTTTTTSSNSSVYIPIHASASVEITGDRYLHGWMQHRFQSKPKPEFQLACRARQFSSFLILLGTVSGPDKFDPKDAIILQNKDEVLIPLLTTVLPSAKEFKDAIHSLSPEQQDFAKAFRGMQLESSVFGVCIIQIKPQLEKLLGLPNGALTKEIQLTQDLMSLFVDYQVPSDLMTFEGPAASTLAEKVETVKDHVGSIKTMIEESKASQLKEEQMRADMRVEMSTFGAPPALFGASAPAASGGFFGAPAPADTARFGAAMAPSGAMVAAAPMAMTSSGFGAPPAASARLNEGSESSQRRLRKKEVMAPPKASASLNYAAGKAPALRSEFSNTATNSITATTSVELSKNQGSNSLAAPTTSSGEDFTMIPKMLDAKLDELELDAALRSTVIKAGSSWTRTRQENFLTAPTTMSLASGDVSTERKKAFDLLDAISRSGTLAIDCSELHVFVALSHCFDNDVLGTVVQDNINPIAKVERSSLLLASTIHGLGANQTATLIQHETDRERLQQSFPRLFAIEAADSTTSSA